MNEDKTSQKNIESTEKLIFQPGIELMKEFAEISIDEIIKDGSLLEKLPLVNIFSTSIKTTIGINNKFFYYKLGKFITELNSGQESGKLKDKYEKLIEGKNKGKIISYIFLRIERFDDEIKATILAQLFKSFLQGNIKWERFMDIAIGVENTHPAGFIGISQLCQLKDYMQHGLSLEKRSMLNGTGFLLEPSVGAFSGVTGGPVITELGQDLYNNALSKIDLFRQN